MREIKYRMWNKKEKKMYQVGVLDFDDEKAYIKNYLNYTVSNYMFEDIELMQFTGLHDKNGKEIYEGDIVQQIHYVFSNDEYDHKGFKKLIMQVLWGQKEAAFVFKVIKKIDIEMPKDYKEPYREVIGNIYENSDLLKGADNIEL